MLDGLHDYIISTILCQMFVGIHFVLWLLYFFCSGLFC